MPTHHERLFHGIGAGDDLAVAETPLGRIGGLICWENRMPLARYAVYRGGPQIWIAPTADDSDGWLASMRHIAIESGAFVVSAPQYIPASPSPTTSRSTSRRASRYSAAAAPRSWSPTRGR
jgi:nitrilase